MSKPLSYSGISAYEQCPSKFNRKYNLKEVVAQPPTPQTAPAMFRGTRLHAELEDLLNGKTDAVNREIAFYGDFARELKAGGAKAEVEFCLTDDWEFQPFDSEDGLLRGVMDVEHVTEGEKIGEVYDWKTGKVYESHADQRALYALVLLLKYPAITSVYSASVYLDQKKMADNTYQRDRLDGYKWVWKKRAEKTRPPQEYPMRPSWKCRVCEFSTSKGGTCTNG